MPTRLKACNINTKLQKNKASIFATFRYNQVGFPKYQAEIHSTEFTV